MGVLSRVGIDRGNCWRPEILGLLMMRDRAGPCEGWRMESNCSIYNLNNSVFLGEGCRKGKEKVPFGAISMFCLISPAYAE